MNTNTDYLSLFYIAFAKPFLPNDPCILNDTGRADCMLELQTQLMSIVIAKATIEQVIELAVPNLLSLLSRLVTLPGQRKLRSTVEANDQERERLLERGAVIDETLLHRPVRDDLDNDEDGIRATLDEYKRIPYEDTIDDYGEIIIQHGFLVLFGVAFPLAALVNLINDSIEFRTDTYKVLAFHRRPEVDMATDIGGWLKVIQLMSTLSIVTSVAVLTITTPALQLVVQQILPASIGQKALDYPVLSFMIAEHLLLLVRWVVNSLISETPGSTYRLRARRAFLMARCLNVGWKPYFRSRRSNQSHFHRHRFHT